MASLLLLSVADEARADANARIAPSPGKKFRADRWSPLRFSFGPRATVKVIKCSLLISSQNALFDRPHTRPTTHRSHARVRAHTWVTIAKCSPNTKNVCHGPPTAQLARRHAAARGRHAPSHAVAAPLRPSWQPGERRPTPSRTVVCGAHRTRGGHPRRRA
eukprot:scaffold222399_cov29-Tisochrysis_lutea.AAC.7